MWGGGGWGHGREGTGVTSTSPKFDLFLLRSKEVDRYTGCNLIEDF